MKNIFLGWLVGTIIACIVNVSITLIFQLQAMVAFATGLVLGAVCSVIGVFVGAQYD